jgi:acetyl esterase/lipase
MKTLLCLPLLLALLNSFSPAAEKKPAEPKKARAKADPVKLTSVAVKSEDRVYKTTPQGELKLHLFFPPDWKPADRRPVMVFFFGGGWRSGSFTQFVPQAEYFAARGLVTASADYRIANVHQTTPDKCIEDAKSAVRWLRAHAAELGIDPGKLIAAGGSAGGHLAAATALVPGFDTPGEDTQISCVPDALVLFNPALNFPEHSVKDAQGNELGPKFWPTPFLTRRAPPTIILFGTADRMWPQGQEFVRKATRLGSRAELWVAADQPHGFFNRPPWLQTTTRQADLFLSSLGYLKGAPTLKPADPQAVLKAEL